ncbi:unnamed protein product [Parascedosporium putredinis]|uniref:Uncharacterized protein n=1 Tax=Parascedosporium putredinis TaxID=1442378 RepID=A0A9P1HD07_9PEZI|nr:unnamed protein product [Parascedosporium putredinis]CAI8003859.1 unnamed protein product [Parascedosporium putredinis]
MVAAVPRHLDERSVQTTITVIQNNNLDVIDQLTQLAESQFGALIQSQIALVSQLQTIKDNIRVNHFRSRFSQANTVIVTVTCVLDRRNGGAGTNRYLVNQLLADNGAGSRNIAVMVSDAETMTILPTATGSSFASQFTASTAASSSSQHRPPTLNLIFPDPAAIIFPNQAAFIESPNTFFQSCANFASNGNSFVNLGGAFLNGFQQIAAAQLAGLRAQWLVRFGAQPLGFGFGFATSTSTSTAAAATSTS